MLIENSSNLYFYLFSILNYKIKQTESKIGSCFSDNHFARDQTHADIISNIEEPKQKYRSGKVGRRIQGGDGDGESLLGTKHRPLLLQWLETFS